MSPLAVLPILACGVADRVWGSDVEHGRRWSIGIALAANLAFGAMAGGARGLGACGLLTLAFLATRSFGFRMFGGSSTPRTLGRFLALVLRHAVATVPAAALAGQFLLTGGFARPVAIFAAWALVAGLLGLAYGQVDADAREAGRPIDPIANVIVESARGLAFGLALYLAVWGRA